MPEVKGQVTQDALDRARPDQGSSPAGANTVMHGLLGQVLDQVAHPDAGEGGLLPVALGPIIGAADG